MRVLRLLVVFMFGVSSWAIADTVTPTDDVTTGVIVRASASSTSARRGRLNPGEQAQLLGSVPNWHHIQLANGKQGYVPKRWTRVVSAAPAPQPTTSSFTMDVVDVGTGLGILLRGEDFTLVYDAGSNDDLARGSSNRMLAFMKAVMPNVNTINYMILSHPHRDHVELLPDLFGAYQVKEVWDSGRVNDICGYRAFIQAIHDAPGVKYHNALQDFGTQSYSFAAGSRYSQTLPAANIPVTLDSRITNTPIALGQNAIMTILHADGSNTPSPNDNSLVVRLDLNGTRVLLMGDAQAGGRADPSTAPNAASIEGALLACCAGDLAARVMVVGHHGSKTSSRQAFINAVGASTFIVSSGPTKYASVTLPDQEIIAELSALGQVFRTDANDQACAMNPAKIGPDTDGRAGGCDNIRVVIPPTGPVQVSVWHGSD